MEAAFAATAERSAALRGEAQAEGRTLVTAVEQAGQSLREALRQPMAEIAAAFAQAHEQNAALQALTRDQAGHLVKAAGHAAETFKLAVRGQADLIGEVANKVADQVGRLSQITEMQSHALGRRRRAGGQRPQGADRRAVDHDQPGVRRHGGKGREDPRDGAQPVGVPGQCLRAGDGRRGRHARDAEGPDPAPSTPRPTRSARGPPKPARRSAITSPT